MFSTDFQLQCENCARQYHEVGVYRCPDCGGALDIVYDYSSLRSLWAKGLAKEPMNGALRMWTYAPVLPATLAQDLRLGEGGTPLVRSVALGEKWGIKNLYFKCEHLNPTGSFKDRQIAVALAAALEYGIEGCITSSSGNAGAALSTYAARVGMKSIVLVPSSVPRGKLTQIISHGSQVICVERASDDAQKYLARAEAVRSLAETRGWSPVITARSVNPFAVEGAKTIAYEVCQGLGWKAPDYVFMPIGGGGLIGSNWKGYRELQNADITSSVPRLIGVQPSGCSTVARAIVRDDDHVEPVIPSSTVSGVGAPMPYDADWALQAIRESSGTACEVPDNATFSMVRELALSEGIFVEPAGAISVAGLAQLVKDGRVTDDDVVVCYLTGSGFKSLPAHDDLSAEREVFTVDIDELGNLVS